MEDSFRVENYISENFNLAKQLDTLDTNDIY